MDTFYKFRPRGRILAGLGSLVDPDTRWDLLAVIVPCVVYVRNVFASPLRVPGPSNRGSKSVVSFVPIFLRNYWKWAQIMTKWYRAWDPDMEITTGVTY